MGHVGLCCVSSELSNLCGHDVHDSCCADRQMPHKAALFQLGVMSHVYNLACVVHAMLDVGHRHIWGRL